MVSINELVARLQEIGAGCWAIRTARFLYETSGPAYAERYVTRLVDGEPQLQLFSDQRPQVGRQKTIR